MEPFEALIIPAMVLAIMVGSHFRRQRARTSGVEIVETDRAKSIRILGEVIAALAWLAGSVMTLFCVGFIRADEPVAVVVEVIAFFGLIPVAISALIFAAADRHIRPWYRTAGYVFLSWGLVATLALVSFFSRR